MENVDDFDEEEEEFEKKEQEEVGFTFCSKIK